MLGDAPNPYQDINIQTLGNAVNKAANKIAAKGDKLGKAYLKGRMTEMRAQVATTRAAQGKPPLKGWKEARRQMIIQQREAAHQDKLKKTAEISEARSAGRVAVEKEKQNTLREQQNLVKARSSGKKPAARSTVKKATSAVKSVAKDVVKGTANAAKAELKGRARAGAASLGAAAGAALTKSPAGARAGAAVGEAAYELAEKGVKKVAGKVQAATRKPTAPNKAKVTGTKISPAPVEGVKAISKAKKPAAVTNKKVNAGKTDMKKPPAKRRAK